LEKTKDTPETNPQWNRLKGEVYFLRAMTYHYLVALYGGVPIIKEPASLSQSLEDLKVPRNTYEECINFIVADLDLAASLLPLRRIISCEYWTSN